MEVAAADGAAGDLEDDIAVFNEDGLRDVNCAWMWSANATTRRGEWCIEAFSTYQL